MKSSRVMILIVFASFLAGCASGPGPEALAETYVVETEVALSAAISLTPTSSETPVPSDTPIPTHTPTITPSDTPTPTSTNTSTATPDYTATEVVKVTAQADELIKTIQPLLEKYSPTTESGKLGWVQDKDVELYVDTYGTIVYDFFTPVGRDFNDFVLSVDITWSSKSGLAGCGLIFLADQMIESGEQYRFYTMRFSGLPAWDIEFYNYGDFQYTVTGDIRFNNAINLLDDSTNRYLLIHQNNVLTIYANDTRLGIVDITSRNEGSFGIFGYQESGKTSCIFKNAWVWELEKD